MIKIKSKSFFNILRANRVLGIALFPFIIYRDQSLEQDSSFWRHEQIHLRQQLELLVLPFFLWYGIEFLIRLVYYRNWDKAYRNISFEREAYAQEDCEDYLKQRSFWSFLNYLKSN